MASSSSSSAASGAGAGPDAGGNAENQTGNPPRRIPPTMGDLLLSFRGSVSQWSDAVRKYAMTGVEERCARRMGMAQVNMWYILATRDLHKRQTGGRTQLPMELRRRIIEFMGPIEHPALGISGRDALQISKAQRASDRARAVAYYSELIKERAEAGEGSLLVDAQTFDAAPRMRNGDAVHADTIATYFGHLGHIIEDRRGNTIDVLHHGSATVPFRISFNGARHDDATGEAAMELLGKKLSAPLERKYKSNHRAAFAETMEKTRNAVVMYFSDYLLKEFASGKVEVEITEAIVNAAPKLPCGAAYPMTERQAKLFHSDLDESDAALSRLRFEVHGLQFHPYYRIINHSETLPPAFTIRLGKEDEFTE
ncbi:unnamed protein product [Amoebophrya sp. A120]|nr:unnamed protein product [Amoebophrya sp. A120]|eukprot:GSA120T00012668001.1